MMMMNNNINGTTTTTTGNKLKPSNPNQKLFLLNGYNMQTPPVNNTNSSLFTNTSLYNSQQQAKPFEKIHKLEIEKLNLQYQVKLLKKQLNSDLLSSKSGTMQQQYNEINNNSNSNYAKAFLMTLSNNKETNGSNDNHQMNESQQQQQQQQMTMNETQQLRNQLKIYEEEREFYSKKIKELQEENLLLHTRLNQQQNGNGYHVDEKDEVERLRKSLVEMAKSNEEKEKKIDELTKQVLRFKRIQEIVLSAQNGVKNKNLELDFDNSDSNSIPSINSDKDIKESQLQMQRSLNGLVLLKRNDSSTPPSQQDQQQQQHQQQQQQNKYEQISASSSVSSTNTSNGMLNVNGQNNNSNNTKSLSAKNLLQNEQQQQQQSQNENHSRHHYNTLPNATVNNSLTLTNYLRSLNQHSINENIQLLTNSTTTISNDTRKLTLDVNSGYTSDGPHSKYSLNAKSRKLAPSEGLEKHKHRSLKNFFGKLMRTNSGSMRDSSPLSRSTVQTDTECEAVFKRGGYLRSTTGTKLKQPADTITNRSISNFASLLNTEFAKFNTEKVCQWLESNGFEHCVNDCKSNIKNGLQLLQMTPQDYEKSLGLRNPLHRKRLNLHLQTVCNTNSEGPIDPSYAKNLSLIDTNWISKWLDDIGLPQYKDYFQEARMDGIVLYNLTNEDLINLNVHSELHHIGIKRAIQVLKLNNFNPTCLKRRPTADEKTDKADVINWTNHRCMEWLRSIDLSEYAPNLRGSGVHGGLMVFEPRFNSTVLADILSIPGSKTLLRRHLNTHFIELIGAENQLIKREAELQPSFQPLSAANKIKLVKRGGGIFSSHKRTKSSDPQENFLCPIEVNQSNYSAKTLQERNQFKSKLSILAQENVPTSIV